MKIKGKLTLGFGVLLLITTFVAAYGVGNIVQIRSQHEYMMDGPVEGRQILRYIEVRLMDVRRIVTFTALYTGDADNLRNAEEDLTAAYAALTDSMEQFRQLLVNDHRIDSAVKGVISSQIAELERSIEQYMSQVVQPILVFAWNNDRDGTLAMI